MVLLQKSERPRYNLPRPSVSFLSRSRSVKTTPSEFRALLWGRGGEGGGTAGAEAKACLSVGFDPEGNSGLKYLQACLATYKR